ncbi:MAG: alanine racemase [Actinomycetota bacterium]|nr:alanine racemase [Actinomycetota bacterium]
MTPRYRGTVVSVDLDAVRHNVRSLLAGPAALMAVVKGNGYGHGAVAVAEASIQAGATWLGVALVEEGVILRDAGITVPILVLSEFPAGSEREALGANLTPTLCTAEGLARLRAAASSPIDVHVKIDTGMHRIGVWPPEQAAAFVGDVVAAGMVLEGLWTHLARAEDDEPTTMQQLTRFVGAVDDVKAAGHVPAVLHAANSAATILYPTSHFDLVRPGIAIYGIQPAPGIGDDLRPALSWLSTVSMAKRLPAGERLSYGHQYELTRESWIATVPVGYADGYPRAASSRAEVLIGGRRFRVAGSVTMDQLMVDCGEHEPRPGEPVVLLGEQGGERITAEEFAGHQGTIAYESVVRIGERVPREYVG